MKMKILSLLALIGIVSAQEPATEKEYVKQQFGYVDLGLGPMPLLLPFFGTGYRSQWNHHGMDVSAQVTTVVYATAVQGNVLYHYYFKPSLASQTYVGGGVTPTVVFGSGEYGTSIAPSAVIGKQYRNESNDIRFLQAQIQFPTVAFDLKDKHGSWWERKHHKTHLVKFPIVILSYGLGF